jgi:hypothetical protein
MHVAGRIETTNCKPFFALLVSIRRRFDCGLRKATYAHFVQRESAYSANGLFLK